MRNKPNRCNYANDDEFTEACEEWAYQEAEKRAVENTDYSLDEWTGVGQMAEDQKDDNPYR